MAKYYSFRQAIDQLGDYPHKLALLDTFIQILNIEGDIKYDEDGIPVGTIYGSGIESVVASISDKLIQICTTSTELNARLAFSTVRGAISSIFYAHNTIIDSAIIDSAIINSAIIDSAIIDSSHPLLPLIRIYLPDSTIDEQIEQLQEIKDFIKAYKLFIEQHPTGKVTDEDRQIFVDQYKLSMKNLEDFEEN